MLNSVLCLSIAFWDLICEEIIGMNVLLEYIGTGLVWALSSYHIRKEYLQLGRHSNYMMAFWSIMLLLQVGNMFITLSLNMDESFFMNTKVHSILLLSMYGALVIVGYYQPIDSIYIRRPSEDTYYQSLKEIPKQKSNIDEGVWSKLNEVSYYSELEKKQEEEKQQEIREKIQNVVVEDYQVKETLAKTVVVRNRQYYIIKVYRGKKGTIVSETRRRYREFFNLYNDLKKDYRRLKFPIFPAPISSRYQVDEEVIEKRMREFDEFLKFLVDQDIKSNQLLEFLQPKSIVDYYGKKVLDPEERDTDRKKSKETEQEIPELIPRNKQIHKTFAPSNSSHIEDEIHSSEDFPPGSLINQRMMREDSISSCLEDMAYTVSITTTYNSGMGYKKHTMYEIEVQTERNTRLVSRRFTDFKKLDDKIRKKYGKVGQLPQYGMGVSSTDPRVVADRRFKLQKYLEDLISHEGVRTDPAVLEFLELDKLI